MNSPVKLSKKEVSEVITSLFDNDIENLEVEKLSQIEPKEFYKEVMKQKKVLGWKSRIKVPCNWHEDKAIKILEKLNDCRLVLNGEQFEELWNIISASADISVWGSDTWAPRVLPNGAVLIRNHHRVIGIDDQTCGSIQIFNEDLQKQLVKIRAIVEENFNGDEDHYKFHFVHRSEEGFDWTVNVPEKLNDFGQTLIFISSDVIEKAKEVGEDVLGDDHFIFDDNVSSAAANSRSGHCVIRVFKHYSFLYSTYRASDEFDSIVENYAYYLGSEPDEGPNEQRVSSEGKFIVSSIRGTLEENDAPEIFNKSLLKHGSSIIKTLFSEKFYTGYAGEKSSQMMQFPPIFGVNAETPSTYYGDEIPFLEYSNKFDGRLIVAKSYYAVFDDVSNLKSQFNDHLSEISTLIDDCTLKLYMPVPGDVKYDQEEDIFEYESKEYKKRLDSIVKALKKMYEDDLKENPLEDGADPTQAEKDWLDSYGYDYEFAILAITRDNVNLVDVHKYGLKLSGILNNSATLIVPAFGFYQGYSDGELDTGNVNIFLTSEQQEESNDDDDDEEYYEEDDE